VFVGVRRRHCFRNACKRRCLAAGRFMRLEGPRESLTFGRFPHLPEPCMPGVAHTLALHNGARKRASWESYTQMLFLVLFPELRQLELASPQPLGAILASDDRLSTSGLVRWHSASAKRLFCPHPLPTSFCQFPVKQHRSYFSSATHYL
jgi:hypothetical protein